jgi:hypothetical protein
VSERVDADRADDIRLEENLFPFFDLSSYLFSEAGGFRQGPEGMIQAGKGVTDSLLDLIPGGRVRLVYVLLQQVEMGE